MTTRESMIVPAAEWDAMKARAESAEAQLKAKAESGIWTTVEDLAALHQRLAEAEAQAAAMLVVEQDAEGRVSHIANADLCERGRALLSRLRALEAVAEAARVLCQPGNPHYRSWDALEAALSALDAQKETT